MNQALLAKAGWRILKHDQGVWCKLFRNKYLTKSSITDGGGQKHAACSNVWRCIQHGASLVAKGIRWRFGNGHSIIFWSDVWVESLGHLRDYAIVDVCDNIVYSTVSSFIVDNRWDIERLAVVLPWQVVHWIADIFISSDVNVVDSVIWGCDGQGEFSVKSAYNNLLLDDVNLWDWRFVWKLKLPPKIHLFLWSLLHGKILTNKHRTVRGMAVDEIFPRCGVGVEDSDHLLRGCVVSMNIWEKLQQGCTRSVNFRSDFGSWLRSNRLDSKSRYAGMPSYLLFAISVWHIWKWRCSRVFYADFQVPLGPHIPIVNYALAWWKANYMQADIKNSISLLSWTPSSIGWLKVNVDGSAANGIISAGGVIRDHEKNWMRGFSMNIGGGSILEAELWGILEGLKMVSTFSLINFVLLSDSADAIGLVNGEVNASHQLLHIIQECKKLLDSRPLYTAAHCFRKENGLANGLAKLGHMLDRGTTTFEEPPTPVFNLFQDDCTGVIVVMTSFGP
ncbi:hypothetical protein ACOSQ4_029488 [Xanthoceras sorbifolium]